MEIDKKTENEQEATKPKSGNGGDDNNSKGLSTGWIIFWVVVIFLGLVGIYWYFKKKDE